MATDSVDASTITSNTVRRQQIAKPTPRERIDEARANLIVTCCNILIVIMLVLLGYASLWLFFGQHAYGLR